MDRHEMFEWEQYGGDTSSYEKRTTHSRHEFMISDDFNASYTYGSYVETINARYNRVEPESYLQQNGESKAHYLGRKVLAIKPYELLYSEYEGSELKRALSRFDLIFVGIGAIVGTGIFVLSGRAAAQYAGPAVAISFVIAGVAAGNMTILLFTPKKKI
jgi:basic amino acid/polyamine antiporter, APA family